MASSVKDETGLFKLTAGGGYGCQCFDWDRHWLRFGSENYPLRERRWHVVRPGPEGRLWIRSSRVCFGYLEAYGLVGAAAVLILKQDTPSLSGESDSGASIEVE